METRSKTKTKMSIAMIRQIHPGLADKKCLKLLTEQKHKELLSLFTYRELFSAFI